MIGIMAHRGPDEFGAWRDDTVFLGHARLSIIDLTTGQQPMCNEDGSLWIVFNGEIYNYPELTAELEGHGHRFRTRADTEVIVHAYEQWGPACVDHFNGQFAFAIWDRRRRRLFLARDRFGIRPLFIARHGDVLLFASEIKSLAAWPGFPRQIDARRLAEVFTYWVNIAPATVFRGVAQLPPGHTALVEVPLAAAKHDGQRADPPPAPLPDCLQLRRYWYPKFLPADEDRRAVSRAEAARTAEELREKLVAAATIRLRADVPVGAYLSGGLDSSTTVALIHHYTDRRLQTFAVGFGADEFDESRWQQLMARHIGADLCSVQVADEEIARRFAEVVWHSETPLLRTAPAPLLSLSQLVRDQDFKVVLTGEGADEVFAGYNIFREAKVRAFWRRRPGDTRRARLLSRLYPYLEQSPPQFLQKFYGVGLERPDDPFFSHRPRWHNTGMMTTFLRPDARRDQRAETAEQRLAASLPAEFDQWGVVAQAQYLEMSTFMAGYLLSSQGDRMLMANSVEGRFPFLDHELADFAATIPAATKLQSLEEKAILKQSVADLLPADIVARSKQPYRAPASASFSGPAGREFVEALLAAPALARTGFWQEDRVAALLRKWRAGRLGSVRENMGWLGIVSSQCLAQQYGSEFSQRCEEAALRADQLVWRDAGCVTRNQR